MAKILDYQCATNTRFIGNDVTELDDMFKFLSSLEVDGHTIRPVRLRRRQEGHGQAAGARPETVFPERDMTREKFARIEEWGKASRFSERRCTRNFSPASVS